MDTTQRSKLRLDHYTTSSLRNQEITRSIIKKVRKVYDKYINMEVQTSIKSLGSGELNYKRCIALQGFIKNYCLISEKQKKSTHEVVIAVDDILKKKNLRGKKLGSLINQRDAYITILSISKKANQAIEQSAIDFEIPAAHRSVYNFHPVKKEACCVLY